MSNDPKLILLFSGKRKCGKDYICDKIYQKIGANCCSIVRISGPLKGLYAKNHDLDLGELLSDGPYKENYRRAMIEWSDEIRFKDPGFFCQAACDSARRTTVWIVSDIRRKTDIEWFKRAFPGIIQTVRVEADLETRKKRGWVFTEGVDDVASECDLDDCFEWDFRIKNNTDDELNDSICILNHSINKVLQK